MSRRTAIIVLAALVLLFMVVVAVDWWLLSPSGKPAVEEAAGWPDVPLPPLTAEPRPLENAPFNLLVLGLGSGAQGRTGADACDAVSLFHVDERLKRIALLSIPAGTYVDIQGYGKRTLGEVYGLGGIDLVEQVVEDITGMPVRNSLALEQEGFAWLVDMLGGVQFNLQEDVSDPRWGSLEAGPVLLDGNGALLVTCSNSYPGELDRIRARQAFLISAANQVHRAASQPAFAWLVNLGMDEFRTGLGIEEAIRLAREFGSWPVVDVSAGIAPGASGSIGNRDVYLLDPEKMEETVRSIEASATVPAI